MEEKLLDVLERIAKFLGAIDSQMTLQTRMMAADRGIPIKWHDPSIEPWPASTAVHGGDVEPIKDIKLGLPYHLRASKNEGQS